MSTKSGSYQKSSKRLQGLQRNLRSLDELLKERKEEIQEIDYWIAKANNRLKSLEDQYTDEKKKKMETKDKEADSLTNRIKSFINEWQGATLVLIFIAAIGGYFTLTNKIDNFSKDFNTYKDTSTTTINQINGSVKDISLDLEIVAVGLDCMIMQDKYYRTWYVNEFKKSPSIQEARLRRKLEQVSLK